jgi:hypothetical protein
MDAAGTLAEIPPVAFAITKRAFLAPVFQRVAAAASIDADVTRAWQAEEVLASVRGFLERRAATRAHPKD